MSERDYTAQARALAAGAEDRDSLEADIAAVAAALQSAHAEGVRQAADIAQLTILEEAARSIGPVPTIAVKVLAAIRQREARP